MMTFFLSILVPLLAQGADEHSYVSVGGAVAIITALGIFAGHITGKKAGRAESVEIKGQPLMVKLQKELQEEFLPRKEFALFEAMLAATLGRDVAEMKSLFRETMEAIRTQNTMLTKKIENQGMRIGKEMDARFEAAGNGRKSIWAVVNEEKGKLRELSGEMKVTRSLNEFGDAIREALEAGKEAKGA